MIIVGVTVGVLVRGGIYGLFETSKEVSNISKDIKKEELGKKLKMGCLY